MKHLQEIALTEIIPEWEEDVCRPDRNWPSHEWLVDNGYAHLRWILEEKHDTRVPEFFSLIAGRKAEETYWCTSSLATIQKAEAFLDWCEKYRNWRENTRKTIRALLNTVIKKYIELYGEEDLYNIANDPDRQTEAYEKFTEVIYEIKEECESDRSAYKHLRAIQRYYECFRRRHRIKYNPTANIEKEFNWDREDDGAIPLTPEEVGELWAVCSSLLDYLIVIGYVMWGVRRKELPSIHESQLERDGDNLLINFEETDRKNGAGTVAVLIGERIVRKQLKRLSTISSWGGHLLVNSDEPANPLSAKQAADRFRSLAEEANIVKGGAVATPNNARATWNDFQTRADAKLMEIARNYKDLQGSVDESEIVRYQGEKTREQVRQTLFINELKQALPDGAIKQETVFIKDIENQLNVTDQF